MDDREDRIRAKAYSLWEQEGRPEGRHQDHWRQAEASMGESSGAPTAEASSSVETTSRGQQGAAAPQGQQGDASSAAKPRVAALRGGPQRGAAVAGTTDSQREDAAS